jgi:cell division protein FtsB
VLPNASAMPAPEQRPIPRKPGITRQILTNTRLVALLICSGLFLLGMMWLTIWGDRGLLAVQHKQQEVMRLAREVEIVEQENARLGHEIQRLRVDMVYLEKIARENIGLVRPGELVFEFVE